MKVTILALLAVAAVASAGLIKTNAIPWDEIDGKVNEIEQIVEANLAYVVAEATRGDPEIGAEIAAYVEQKRPEFEALLARIDAEVTAQTLTVESTEAYEQEFDALVEEMMRETEDDISHLPEENQQNISDRIYADLAAVHAIVDEVIVLLQQ